MAFRVGKLTPARQVDLSGEIDGYQAVADILAGHTLLWAKSARLDLGSDTSATYLDTLTKRGAFTRARKRAHVLPTPPD